MIHQPLGGTNGQVSDLEIMTQRFIALKNKLNLILAQNTSQNVTTQIHLRHRRCGQFPGQGRHRRLTGPFAPGPRL